MFKKITIAIVMAEPCLLKQEVEKLIRKVLVLVALSLCILNSPLWAQTIAISAVKDNDAMQQHSAIKTAVVSALKIGEKLPEAFWKQEFLVYGRGKMVQQNLLAYKEKIVIFDFWASWCSGCLHHFSQLDSLQKQYEGLVAIVLVNSKNTRDTPEKIQPLMDQFAPLLSSIIGDTILTKQFPHRLVPHYVWIANGTLTAATGSEFLHPANITALLDRQQRLLEARNRAKANTNKP